MIKKILPAVVFVICVVLTGYGEDPYFPQTDPENHGIPLEVLEELSVAINEYFESDYIVGAEFLITKSGHTIMHKAYGWMDLDSLA